MTDTSILKRIVSNPKSVLLVALMLISVIGAGAVGSVAAQEDTATPTPTSTPTETSESNELADQTVEVDNDTQDVYLEVTNTSGDALNYTVYGVEDGVTTEVETGQISAEKNDTTRDTWSADSEEYDSYRIILTEDPTDSDTETVEEIDIGATVDQSADEGSPLFGGGGSGIFTPMNIVIGLLALSAAWLVGLFDPIKRRIAG